MPGKTVGPLGVRRRSKMSLKLRITRTVHLPNRLRLARLARAPELGPKILFLSGGSALNQLSRALINYTHNSIHLITPFDSGGSSARLRQAFQMPAVGDLRNRLTALADQTVKGNPDITRLFSFRFPKEQSPEELDRRLDLMLRGRDGLIAAIPDPMRKIIRTHLGFFRQSMPENFDLRGASIGNLVLTGGYLENDRHLDPVIFLFSKLAEVRGTVRPVLNKSLHLVAELENGQVLIGQHLLTGREVPPITSPVKKVYLSFSKKHPEPIRPSIRQKTVSLIEEADLICYPVGSFYSSLIANLLPDGVTRTMAQTESPKIFIPNPTSDPEVVGASVSEMAETLIDYLMVEASEEVSIDRLLNFVLVDSKKGQYPGGLDRAEIERLGVAVIDTDLITPRSRPFFDPELLLGVLLSLA